MEKSRGAPTLQNDQRQRTGEDEPERGGRREGREGALGWVGVEEVRDEGNLHVTKSMSVMCLSWTDEVRW